MKTLGSYVVMGLCELFFSDHKPFPFNPNSLAVPHAHSQSDTLRMSLIPPGWSLESYWRVYGYSGQGSEGFLYQQVTTHIKADLQLSPAPQASATKSREGLHVDQSAPTRSLPIQVLCRWTVEVFTRLTCAGRWYNQCEQCVGCASEFFPELACSFFVMF